MRFQFQAGAAVERKSQVTTAAPRAALTHRGDTAQLRHAALTVAVLAAMAGCASSDRAAVVGWKVSPMLDVTHGAPSSNAYHTLGRYHEGSQAWDKADEAYRKAIAANPRNAEAHNALGVLLARCQRLADAEAALRQALAIAPDSAHVRSNLGRVLLLAGRPQEAAGELATALQFDPGNPVAQANLREALAPSAQAPSTGAATAAEPQVAAVQAAGVQAAEPQAAEAPVASTLPVIAPPVLARVRLELSNGNGMRGAAARLKPQLLAEGLAVERLTNQRPYVQRMTVIQYRTGQLGAAQRVADALRTTAPLEVVHGTGPGPDVRVVLGHDWARAPAWTAWASR